MSSLFINDDIHRIDISLKFIFIDIFAVSIQMAEFLLPFFIACLI